MKLNRGFSLVELIVVIAIMAVLVGIITPQFLNYVENARAQVCSTSRNEIERQVSTTLAGDVDGTFREFLNTNYGVSEPDDISNTGNDIGPLLSELNLDSKTNICKSDGNITANYYQTDDNSTFIFKLVCSEHDDIELISLIDFGDYKKESMQTMGSIILDMYDYYVADKYGDQNWKTQFSNSAIESSDSDYYEFSKFGYWTSSSSASVYADDIDDFIQATVNDNQSSTILNHGSGNNDTKLYFESDNKDLTENKVHSVYTCIDHVYYVYFPDSDTLYNVSDAHSDRTLRVDEDQIQALVSSGEATIIE